MTDPKPVSVQACDGHAQQMKRAPHGPVHRWRNSFRPALALPPWSANGADASTDGFHPSRATVMTAADRRGSTVMAEIVTVCGDSVAEEPGSLGSTDRVVDRIRTDLVEAFAFICQPGSNS